MSEPGSVATTELELGVSVGRAVLLVAGPSDDDAGSHEQVMLRAHSPVISIMPDGAPGVAAPYRGQHDYHPRTVDAFLQRVVRVGLAVPQGAHGIAWLALIGSYAIVVPIVLLWMFTATPMLFHPEEWQLNALIAGFLAVTGVVWFLSRRPLGSAAAVKHEMGESASRDMQSRYLSMAAGSIRDNRQKVWDEYCQEVASGSPYPRAVYGRVVQRGDRMALQYWLFFLYNDWWNLHQADWEVATVFLRRVNDDWVPKAAAYSSHVGGRFRPWPSIDREGDHPRVHVARGSHALYFGIEPGGHETQLQVPLAFRLLRGTLTVSGRERDFVGVPDEAQRLEYELVHIPTGAEAAAVGSSDWDRWWWLQFGGKWGWDEAWFVPLRDVLHREIPIEGPAVQGDGLKWTDPWAWARTCVADAGSWEATGA